MTTQLRPVTAVTAEDLCAQYLAPVHRFAALTCRNDALAEDVAQDAMVKAIRKLSSYDPARGDLDAWLWRIVARTVIDHSRRGQRLQVLAERVSAALRTAPATDVEAGAIERVTNAELHATLRTLPPGAREVLGLRFGAGLTYEEIAAALDLSSAAVRMRASRALQRLRAQLGNQVGS